jgi:predicted anti-sigma-YlaC factor YlaD
MDCATAREAMSALLDGEDPGADRGEVETHVAGCAACLRWREAAHEVTRRARLHVADPGPSRVAEVVAAVNGRAKPRRRPGLVTVARVALAGVAAGQLALTVPCLLFGRDHSAPEHVAHELGAFGAAQAVGFLVAAWRPGRAVGIRALVGVAAVLLLVTAAVDLAAGRTSVGDEAPHLLAIVGWLLVRYLAAVTPPTAEDPRPVLAGVVRAWLHAAPRQRPAASATFAAPAWPAVSQAVPAGGHALGTYAASHDAAACGCAAEHCRCPGCVAPGRVAAG